MVQEHLLVLVVLAEKAPVEPRLNPPSPVEHGGDGADQDDVQPTRALS